MTWRGHRSIRGTAPARGTAAGARRVLFRRGTIDRQDGMIDAHCMRAMHIVREIVAASGFHMRDTHRKRCDSDNGCKDESRHSSWITTGVLPKTRLNSLQETVPDVIPEDNNNSSN